RTAPDRACWSASPTTRTPAPASAVARPGALAFTRSPRRRSILATLVRHERPASRPRILLARGWVPASSRGPAPKRVREWPPQHPGDLDLPQPTREPRRPPDVPP